MENKKILLKDVLRFEELRKENPNRRIKLRFNKYKEYEDITYNFVEWYKEDKDSKKFKDSLLTVWSNKQKRIQDNEIIFQFIEIYPHRWLLVNVHKIISTKEGIADAEELTEYEQYFGRIIVDFVNKGQSWYYVDKEIVDNVEIFEITKKQYLDMDVEFTGYENVCKTYKELKHVIDMENWKTALSNAFGVYVITDRKTGKVYVGSAYGEAGIYGRWKTYLEKGYDKDEEQSGEIDYPNKKLKELVKKNGIDYIKENFQYSILEIFPTTELGKEKALQREVYWKNVLKSRDFGYNDN